MIKIGKEECLKLWKINIFLVFFGGWVIFPKLLGRLKSGLR